MITAHPSSVVQKKDLHFGGLGSTVGTAAPPLQVLPMQQDWRHKATVAANNASQMLQANTWPALALAAAAGVLAGYFLARR